MRNFYAVIRNFFSQTGVSMAIYLGSFWFLYVLFYFFGFIKEFPGEHNLSQWDSGFYYIIMGDGYSYSWYAGSNSAFFPLFPYFWRLLHVGVFGMCVVNGLVTALGIGLLQSAYKITRLETLCFLSIPSCIFLFLPFTEAVFFLGGSMALAGLRKDRTLWVVIGLLCCSLARGTTMFFIPAIVLMEVFASDKVFSKQVIQRIILFAGAAIIGLAAVVFIQYYQTYEWFAFAKVQTKFYRHIFSWPRLPFTSYGDGKILWLDGPAFFFGLLATAIIAIFAVVFLQKKKYPLLKERAFWFCAAYLMMTTVYAVFFNPKSGDGFTVLNSINRYLFATPFFFLFLVIGLRQFNHQVKNIIVFFLVALLTWFCLGLGKPLRFLTDTFVTENKIGIFFGFLTIYVALFYFSSHLRYGKYCAPMLFALNMILSVYALNQYIFTQWIA